MWAYLENSYKIYMSRQKSTEQYGSLPALQYIGMCLYCTRVCVCAYGIAIYVLEYDSKESHRRERLYGNTLKLVNPGNWLGKGGRDFTFLYTTVVLEYFTCM